MRKIAWFRNDLRLRYNNVLTYFGDPEAKFVPLFILDPKIAESFDVSDFRLNFLYESLIDLDKNLKEHNSSLVILQGNPSEVFRLLSEQEELAVYSSSDEYSKFAVNRQAEIESILDQNNSFLESITNLVFIDSSDSKLLNHESKPYRVFSQFRKKWLEIAREMVDLTDNAISEVNIFESKYEIENFKSDINKRGVKTLEVDDLNVIQNQQFRGGETEARIRWEEFSSSEIDDYARDRDFPDLDGTSRLSPYFKFGCLSVYEVVLDCFKLMEKKKSTGASAYLDEIIWREFYKYVIFHFPEVQHGSFQKKYQKIKWENDKNKFLAWCEGRTGYPIVDAFMRQLNQTGWMHNRGRMITASFLTKDLHINWQWGEKYFRSKLIDYDLSANNGGWQWVAGTGTDAAPYFRIFNPVLQSKKFDPNGDFIKKYLPELNSVPVKLIHEPWKSDQKLEYPAPIVDHSVERQKTLELYDIK